MKKIYFILLLLLNSSLIFSEITNEYLSDYYHQKKLDYKLESLFNAIKIFNNRYAMTFLNNDSNNNLNKKVKIGPNIGITKDEEKQLLDRMININSRNSQGYTPLIVSVEYNNDIILQELLKLGVDTNISHPVLGKNILNTAIYYNNYNIVKILLEHDPKLANMQDSIDGWTPIMNAVLKNNIKILKLLLQYGANPLKKDKNGEDALELALQFSKGEAIKIIKDYLKNKRSRL